MSLTCPSASPGGASGEIMLFGVRVVVDLMRKSVSMNNLSQYEQPPESSANQTRISSSNSNGDEGYASADDAVPNSDRNRGRKRGVPWTEEEHKLFLLGLQRVGKGDWRGISRNFVKTRTPTQVASHAQKYFLRRSNINRRRRRSSLFDITTDTVPTITNDEGLRSQQENPVDEPQQALPLLPAETKSSNVLPLLPAYPAAATNPPTKAETTRESMLLGQGRQSDATMFPNSPVFNLGLDSEPVASVSLQLSLSMDQTELLARHSTYGGMPCFSNRDSTQIIGVA